MTLWRWPVDRPGRPKDRLRVIALLLFAFPSSALAAASDEIALDRTVLPLSPPPFQGRIGTTIAESRPAWAPRIEAPAGAPNVVVVMTDDVGFGASSTFGGPIPTPNLDRLAELGLRFSQFHTTGVCSPTRAALLTGRNPHAVGAGQLADTASGFPGYHAAIPKSAATVARILTGNGYASAFYGKHHNVPVDEIGPAGPFDHWPTGLGFQRFLGFLGGDAHQWQPRLYDGLTPVKPDAARAPKHLDEVLTDDAIGWIRNLKSVAPNRPFFLYVATGAGHGPYHAPQEWLERFRGRFDQGWDEIRAATFRRQQKLGIVPRGARISPRPAQIPAWKDLTPTMQRVDARFMEAFAAHVAYQDHQFGRILDELERIGQLDDTLVFFIEGDNGSTAQNGPMPTSNEIGAVANGLVESEEQLDSLLDQIGGPETYGVNSVGWAQAMNAPFPWFKHVASHLGATRNGMVVAWPGRIERGGELRTAFAHVVDVAPTILAAAQLPQPTSVDGVAQQRMDGISLLPIFDDPKLEIRRTQYFELDGNRAIYSDGWLAGTTPRHMPWEKSHDEAEQPPEWKELYDLRTDFTQSVDVAARFPDKLADLEALWDREARRNHVYPIDTRSNTARTLSDPNSPRLRNLRRDVTLWGNGVSVPEIAMPPVGAVSFRVTARITLWAEDTTGPILVGGSRFGGWAFYLAEGRPTVLAAMSNWAQDRFTVRAPAALAEGEHVLTYTFARDPRPAKGGTITIESDGKTLATGRIDGTPTVLAGLGETWDVGHDTGVAVTQDYPSTAFPGDIDHVRITLVAPEGAKSPR